MTTRLRFASVLCVSLLLVSLTAFADEESSERPTAPEAARAAAAPSDRLAPKPASKPAKKAKQKKRNAYKNQDLELAPAPLMIQKP